VGGFRSNEAAPEDSEGEGEGGQGVMVLVLVLVVACCLLGRPACRAGAIVRRR
jgi:hypothetical protein